MEFFRDLSSGLPQRYTPKADRLEIEVRDGNQSFGDPQALNITLEMVLEKAGWRVNSMKSAERVEF
jgi:hypothetical protein